MKMAIFRQNFVRMKGRRIGIPLLVLLLFSGLQLDAQEKLSREEYIETYAELAMREMLRVGIPASIKLAQGCLESGNGNSRLARQGKNHFGIKCHDDWQGRKIYHDDDRKNECFRSYNTDYESFMDHSAFLTTKERYADLFELRPDDYKGWARGLKKAGYATSNKYAGSLIRIIEENELYLYDELVLSGNFIPDSLAPPSALPGDPYAGRQIFEVNQSQYIITEPGDTPKSLRMELDLYPHEIYRYNNLDRDETLEAGRIIFIQPKRCRAEKGSGIHLLKEGETLQDVSNLYGVKLKAILRKNNFEPGVKVEPGTEIRLRGRVKRDHTSIPRERAPREPREQPDDSAEMEFQFDG